MRRSFRPNGAGVNLNVPVVPGSGDDEWLAAVDRLVEAVRAHGSEGLVVPLGVDAAAGDSQAPLAVSEAGFRETGRRLGSLGLPAVLVQEGSYELALIGVLEGVRRKPPATHQAGAPRRSGREGRGRSRRSCRSAREGHASSRVRERRPP